MKTNIRDSNTKLISPCLMQRSAREHNAYDKLPYLNQRIELKGWFNTEKRRDVTPSSCYPNQQPEQSYRLPRFRHYNLNISCRVKDIQILKYLLVDIVTWSIDLPVYYLAWGRTNVLCSAPFSGQGCYKTQLQTALPQKQPISFTTKTSWTGNLLTQPGQLLHE